MAEIVFLTRVLAHYRVPFHEAVRSRLAESGIRYRLLYGQPRPEEAKKGDTATIDWAEPVTNLYLGPRSRLVWQPVLGQVAHADLVVIGQENSLLANYVLQLWRGFGGPRLAFFGHGRNFQAAKPMGSAERFKRLWIRHVDWWFAYTQRSAEVVAGAGFSRERITVFNNAIDSSAITQEIASLDPKQQLLLREELLAGSQNIGVYVGGLYAEKRLAFLIDAARLIRAQVPDFHLIVVGGGPDAGLIEAAARELPWVHYVGPKFGREKTSLASVARVFLMPGLVGLGVLDSFAYGIPMVTTDIPYHSPEAGYLVDGVNGLVTKDDAGAYASAAIRVLSDDAFRAKLKDGAVAAASVYTIEAMGDRFVAGLHCALGLGC
jgi:glycosyltransferase involved in cell wall biosynthesis